MKSKVALAVAIILALISMVLVRQYIHRNLDVVRRSQATVDVVAAAKRIKMNTVITDPDTYFEKKSLSVGALPQDPIMWNDRGDYKEHRLMRNVEGGDLIQGSFFLETREKPEALNLPRGTRAMTIAVDQITGVAGLLRPHSRVDVIGVFQGAIMVPKGMGGGGAAAAAAAQDAVAVTLLSDVTVWALDSRTAAMPPSAATNRRNYTAVTLVLTEKEAELMALAQSKGSIILTMREPTDATYRTYPPNEEPTDLFKLLPLSREANQLRNAGAGKAPPEAPGAP